MTLALIGVNYKTAPIELRERIAISREELLETTRALAAMPGVLECMIVSTCNRVELLAAVDSPDADLAGFLRRRFGLDPELIAPHIYEQYDRDAVRHLFRVAASLDSMVVGEPQILGQVKEAFAIARASGTVATQLEHLMQSAFAAAKKVRSETEIGSNSVSIASVAVDMARKIFGSLAGRLRGDREGSHAPSGKNVNRLTVCCEFKMGKRTPCLKAKRKRGKQPQSEDESETLRFIGFALIASFFRFFFSFHSQIVVCSGTQAQMNAKSVSILRSETVSLLGEIQRMMSHFISPCCLKSTCTSGLRCIT